MGVDPPFSRTFYNCETLLKSTASYTTYSDIEQTIDKEIRIMDSLEDGTSGIRQKVNILMESREGEGIKQVVTTKSKALLAMLKFLSKKQSMGKDLMEAYEAMAPLQQVALRTRDTVIKGELGLEEGIRNINHTITAVETLFEKSKLFLEMEPTEEEFDGSYIAFGPISWPSVLNQESLATIMDQVLGEDPRLMFHVNPLVGCIAEVPYFAGILDGLLKEVRKIKELNSSRVPWTWTGESSL